jgi:hypothetical protein
MKRRLIIIALALCLVNVGGWSMFSQAQAANLKSQGKHSQIHTPHGTSHAKHIQASKAHTVQKASESQNENGSDSENENLPGVGHADKDGVNVDHQFEGVE